MRVTPKELFHDWDLAAHSCAGALLALYDLGELTSHEKARAAVERYRAATKQINREVDEGDDDNDAL